MKYCIKCQMGDPLPHDERLGQAIYNYLRLDEDPRSQQDHIRLQSQMADKLFNIDDFKLQRFIMEKFWCEKCKKGDL